MTAGSGWDPQEFAAVGGDFEHRGAVTEECIEIWKHAWTEPWLDWHGRFYEIADVSLEPKPVQKPHPPIVFGAVTEVGRAGARRARATASIRCSSTRTPTPAASTGCATPSAREGERVGRDLSGFRLYAFASGRVTNASRCEEPPAHAHRQRRAGARRPRALRGARLLARDHALRRSVRDDRRADRDRGALRRGGAAGGAASSRPAFRREAAAVRVRAAAGSVRGSRRARSRPADEAKVLAGGQSLVPLLNMRLARPTVLVDVNRVARARRGSRSTAPSGSARSPDRRTRSASRELARRRAAARRGAALRRPRRHPEPRARSAARSPTPIRRPSSPPSLLALDGDGGRGGPARRADDPGRRTLPRPVHDGARAGRAADVV